MAKAIRKQADDGWNERHGCDGRPPITKPVAGIPDPETRARTVAKRNTNHCTLCRLHHLGHLKDSVSDSSHAGKALSDMRHIAGERLQDDAALAGQTSMPGTLGSLGAGGGSACGPAEISQMRIDADRRKNAALMAVGTSGRFLLTKIVLEDVSAHEVAKLLRTNPQAVTPSLRVALDALAAHYGITQVAKTRVRGGEAQPIHPFHQDGAVRK
jgi:hypothetical protein